VGFSVGLLKGSFGLAWLLTVGDGCGATIFPERISFTLFLIAPAVPNQKKLRNTAISVKSKCGKRIFYSAKIQHHEDSEV